MGFGITRISTAITFQVSKRDRCNATKGGQGNEFTSYRPAGSETEERFLS